jgi:hypothetical protein
MNLGKGELYTLMLSKTFQSDKQTYFLKL